MNPDQLLADSESIPIYYTLSCEILQDVTEKNSEKFEKNAKKQSENRLFRILIYGNCAKDAVFTMAERAKNRLTFFCKYVIV